VSERDRGTSDAEVRRRLTEIFREIFDDESLEIHDAMTAADVDEWDSLNHINLIISVERSFGVKFTTTEVGNLANVGEFIALLLRKIATRRTRT
jgi:acyl carrier protein